MLPTTGFELTPEWELETIRSELPTDARKGKFSSADIIAAQSDNLVCEWSGKIREGQAGIHDAADQRRKSGPTEWLVERTDTVVRELRRFRTSEASGIFSEIVSRKSVLVI